MLRRMTDQRPTVSVELTAPELLLLRQRLSDGPGTPAVDSALDAKLYQAQRRLNVNVAFRRLAAAWAQAAAELRKRLARAGYSSDRTD